MAHFNEQDHDIALETCKLWLNQQDASYLAREDQVVYWEQFNPESKRGEWIKLKPKEVCRIIKVTRSGLQAMKYIKPDLLLLAAQETERAFKQGVNSRSNTPPEYFNFNKAANFNDFEMLTLCMLQVLVGNGWNTEAVALGKLMQKLFAKKGWHVPNRTLRWRLLRAVSEEAGVLIRDRLDRLTVTGVGRFVCIQIDGITDNMKVSFTDEEYEEVINQSLFRFTHL